MPNQTPDEERDERAEALAEKVKDEERAVTKRVERRAKDLEAQRARQAKDLEAQRAGQAEALEEERAGQASALEERRVEHRVEERIEQRADIKTELHGITEAIGVLIQHMDRSIPEERVKQLADAVLAEERLGRKRLTTKIVGFLIVIFLLVLTSFLQSAANGRTLDEARKVSVYVEKCLQHPEKLTAEEKVKECGRNSNINAIKGLLTAINCSLLISPEARTEANTEACAAKAFSGG